VVVVNGPRQAGKTRREINMGEHALPHGDRITAVPLSALWSHAAL
jgi:hypothetical protein